MVAYTDTVPGLLKQIADQGNGGVDSGGNALPANFDSLARDTSDRDAGGFLLSESRTDGVTTWKQTYTRNASGLITNTSRWVVQ